MSGVGCSHHVIGDVNAQKLASYCSLVRLVTFGYQGREIGPFQVVFWFLVGRPHYRSRQHSFEYYVRLLKYKMTDDGGVCVCGRGGGSSYYYFFSFELYTM